MKVKKLPIRPSKLINSTLEDFKWLEKSKKYEINMDTWVDGGKICSFCFGGAALMGSLNRDGQKIKSLLEEFDGELLLDDISYEIDHYTSTLMLALDSIREYNYDSFMCHIVTANRMDNDFKYLQISPEETANELYKRLGDDIREYKYSYEA